MKNKAFVITGTPGSGKTSVIRQLQNQEYSVVHEAATDIIEKQLSNGIVQPWENDHFVDKITNMQKERQITSIGGLQFFDRSPFCTYALAKYMSHWKKIPFNPSSILSDEIDRCIKNQIYQNKVFFFENLGFIEQTNARKISYEDALIFEHTHLDVYKQFGFNIVIVPKKHTVEQRSEFIIKKIMKEI